jgi:hypothetical protein
MTKVVMKITHIPDDTNSITICSLDTIIHIKGEGINWKIPLKNVKQLYTYLSEDYATPSKV